MQSGTKMNWLEFEFKTSRVNVTARRQISAFGDMFSPISGMLDIV